MYVWFCYYVTPFCPSTKNTFKTWFLLQNIHLQFVFDGESVQNSTNLGNPGLHCVCSQERLCCFLWRENTILESLLFPLDSQGCKNICALINDGVTTSYDRSLVTVLDAIAVSTVTELLKFFNVLIAHKRYFEHIYLPTYSTFIASKVKIFWHP
jgi:hypothetical protein